MTRAAIDRDLVRELVGAGIGGSSNSAFVVAVIRDDGGKAAQIVPERVFREAQIDRRGLLLSAEGSR